MTDSYDCRYCMSVRKFPERFVVTEVLGLGKIHFQQDLPYLAWHQSALSAPRGREIDLYDKVLYGV